MRLWGRRVEAEVLIFWSFFGMCRVFRSAAVYKRGLYLTEPQIMPNVPPSTK